MQYYDLRISHNSGITGGAGGRAPPPETSDLTGKFLLTYREKRGKEKWKRGEKWDEKKGNCKRKVEN